MGHFLLSFLYRHRWHVLAVTWMGHFLGAIYNCPNRHGWYFPSMECICHGWDGRRKLSQMGRPNRDLDGTFFYYSYLQLS